MSDLISRQAAIDAICEHGTDLERRGITVLAVVNHKQVTIDLLEHLPSVEVEPVKRGKWIYDNQFHWYRASCSECGYKRVTDIKAEKWNGWKYCPNCGAKMEPISASTENGQEVEE